MINRICLSGKLTSTNRGRECPASPMTVSVVEGDRANTEEEKRNMKDDNISEGEQVEDERTKKSAANTHLEHFSGDRVGGEAHREEMESGLGHLHQDWKTTSGSWGRCVQDRG